MLTPATLNVVVIEKGSACRKANVSGSVLKFVLSKFVEYGLTSPDPTASMLKGLLDPTSVSCTSIANLAEIL